MVQRLERLLLLLLLLLGGSELDCIPMGDLSRAGWGHLCSWLRLGNGIHISEHHEALESCQPQWDVSFLFAVAGLS